MTQIKETHWDRRLASYEEPVVMERRIGAARRYWAICLVVFLGSGLLLALVEQAPENSGLNARAHRISMLIKPEPTIVAPVEVEPEPVADEIPELTPQTVLAQTIDTPKPEEQAIAESVPVETKVEQPEPPKRRVYGVRKVLARGIGRGTGSGGGIVTKRGNVVDGVADTLTATAADLQGQLAALSTVEKAPEPVSRAKPRYSKDLIKAHAGGKVTARMLIDAVGEVRQVEIVKDIGYDSAAVATEALYKFRFKPAERAGKAVAVWIIHHIRFEFQE